MNSKKSNSILTLVLCIILGGAISFIATEATAQRDVEEVIKTKRIVLVDKNGTERATLGTLHRGESSWVSLRLKDENAMSKMALTVTHTGTPEIHLLDKEAASNYRWAGKPSVNFWGKGSRNRLGSVSGTGDVDPVERVDRPDQGPGSDSDLVLYRSNSVTASDIRLLWNQIDEILSTLDEITE
ncbi:MAG: hypothetical protein AAF438_05315 [Pseudomonadota bacterium]